MVYKVSWTLKALDSYLANIHYLEQEWSQKEVQKFIQLVESKINKLRKFPNLGTQRSSKQPGIRHIVIHKRVSLIYRARPAKKEIELLLFWNTWQNPVRLKSI